MSDEKKPEFGAPYQGAREELAIWKRRALEAEAKVREQDQIIDRLGAALNEDNGPTFMGEPVLRSGPCNHNYHLGECTKCGAISPTE
ncbi:hypothetical protein [Pseudomonas chlororaphis]|uniref:hypothetical protein n=1 Tax=Pseudomonas chlororaphis TaxID=587753 RepID=UPI001B32C357|nr:hypothetical protein [Pseudomonas chlororaphis]MBP5055328.1 hypothetical protein [Pseudomonas chlororaphis]MBP5142435.1 hypothetical protein [Pseudomonas chlororaphis]